MFPNACGWSPEAFWMIPRVYRNFLRTVRATSSEGNGATRDMRAQMECPGWRSLRPWYRHHNVHTQYGDVAERRRTSIFAVGGFQIRYWTLSYRVICSSQKIATTGAWHVAEQGPITRDRGRKEACPKRGQSSTQGGGGGQQGQVGSRPASLQVVLNFVWRRTKICGEN